MPEKIIFRHIDPIHGFVVTETFKALDNKTKLSFNMLFDNAEECKKIKAFVAVANEQNFYRLETVLTSISQC